MSGPAPSLYRRPVPLDPAVHGTHRISPLTDFSIARELHAAFVTATEFAQAALEFPIVFVETGQHDAAGQEVVTPVALLGLRHGENLHVDGATWQARYVPASIRRYPFSTATLPGASGINVLVDEAWGGFSPQAAEPLFESGGAPAPALRRAMDFLERLEHETERTRAFCQRIVSLRVLKEMKADATLPNGQRLSVDGFHAVDEERMRELPDSTLLELWRTGLLMLVQAHLLSLANIRHLVNRKAARVAQERPDPGSSATIASEPRPDAAERGSA